MKWQVTALDELKAREPYSLVGGPFGSNLTMRDYVEDGIPVIRGANLSEQSTFDASEFVFVSETKADELQPNNAFPGDLVFTQRGTLGQVGIIPGDTPYLRFVISQSQMKMTVDCAKADARFLFYWFRHPQTIEMIKCRAITSGVPHINLGILKSFKVPNPPLPTQHRIASVLSAYDDLIENNRRRITLLEQAARLLYEEWFVRLKFPGHERTRIVDGVPEGWENKPLESVCTLGDGIQTGPFGSQLHQADYSEEGVPVVMPKDLIGFRIATEGVARVPEELAMKLGRHRMIAGDTVYGRRGDIGRLVFISPRHAGWICGTGCLRIRPNPATIIPRFLFDALGSPATAGTIANRAKGATMLNLNAGVLKSVSMLLASRCLQELYAEQVEPTAALIETLAEQNQKLRAARDLLLPRLMSGQIAA